METVTEDLEFRSAKHKWDWVTNSNPIGAMLVARLTKELGDAVLRALDGMLRERSGGNGSAVLTSPIALDLAAFVAERGAEAIATTRRPRKPTGQRRP